MSKKDFFSEAIGKATAAPAAPQAPTAKAARRRCRRRTLYLPEDTYEQARRYAWKRRAPISAVIDKALRDYLADKEIPDTIPKGEDL